MKMMLRSIGCLAGLALASAQAAPMNPDPTGMWYDPAQPGWGMSVTQQGETIFVALFVYDANHKPQWFVASDVVDTGAIVNFLVGQIYAGTLYSTTGPAFTMPNDTTTLSATPVGTLQIANVQPTTTNKLSVNYTVNGVAVSKIVQPQTWSSNAPQLAGYFAGTLDVQGVTLTQPGGGTMVCDAPDAMKNMTHFTISPTASPDALTITWGSGVDIACRVDGTYTQVGQFGTYSGPVKCGPVASPPTGAGSITISQMVVSSAGFAGNLMYSTEPVNGSSCGVGGTAGGVKIPAPQ